MQIKATNSDFLPSKHISLFLRSKTVLGSLLPKNTKLQVLREHNTIQFVSLDELYQHVPNYSKPFNNYRSFFYNCCSCPVFLIQKHARDSSSNPYIFWKKKAEA